MTKLSWKRRIDYFHQEVSRLITKPTLQVDWLFSSRSQQVDHKTNITSWLIIFIKKSAGWSQNQHYKLIDYFHQEVSRLITKPTLQVDWLFSSRSQQVDHKTNITSWLIIFIKKSAGWSQNQHYKLIDYFHQEVSRLITKPTLQVDWLFSSRSQQVDHKTNITSWLIIFIKKSAGWSQNQHYKLIDYFHQEVSRLITKPTLQVDWLFSSRSQQVDHKTNITSWLIIFIKKSAGWSQNQHYKLIDYFHQEVSRLITKPTLQVDWLFSSRRWQ